MRRLSIDGQDVSRDLLSFAQDLVRIESFSGMEAQLARFIASKMKALGYDEVKIDRYGNVVGRLGRGERKILFDSHMDTVTVNDADQWTQPPFSGEILDGYLWGRGSVDMKSSIAASVYAAAIAKALDLLSGKTVVVSCTVDEEYCDGVGLQHLLDEASILPDFAVICEPSSNLITTGHKGKAQATIKTTGVSAHGSAPEKGVNAIYEMAEIIQRVEKTNRDLMLQRGRKGTLVLSRISSLSASLNAVPSKCEVYLDRRMVLGETVQDVENELNSIVAGKNAAWQFDTLRRKTWTGEELVYRPLHTAWEIDLDHELSKLFVAAFTETFGRVPDRFDYWDFSTNAVATVRLGIPTIGFGPGDHKLAHMLDEKCAIEQIIDACAMYAHVIARL